MAYQNVGTPRFIIDWLSWYKSLGLIGAGESDIWNASTSLPSINENISVLNLIGLNPSSQTWIDSFGDSVSPTLSHGFNINIYASAVFPVHDVNIVGLLGHNFKSISGVVGDIPTNFKFGYLVSSSSSSLGIKFTDDILINAGLTDRINNSGFEYKVMTFPYDGFSFCSVDGAYTEDDPAIDMQSLIPSMRNIPPAYNSTNIKLGSLLLGRYYDMNAPNLSLTMSREYGGIKEFETHNGSSMSNTMWSKPPMWGDLGAWELHSSGTVPQILTKSGRRSWDLKFSFMDDGDLWGSNQSLSFLDIDNNTTFDNNLLTDPNFFSQVWHKTLGGTLPFIFQPDGGANGNNNPDQFCIARFKDNSLKATQSAFNVYDISLSIEEVW